MKKRINSQEKGKRGEREWAEYLREHGYPEARRGRQFRGSPDSPDVVCGIPDTHAEVKRTETLSIYAAMFQAEYDCGDDMPYVAHRRNGKEWLVILRADDFIRVMEKAQFPF